MDAVVLNTSYAVESTDSLQKTLKVVTNLNLEEEQWNANHHQILSHIDKLLISDHLLLLVFT